MALGNAMTTKATRKTTKKTRGKSASSGDRSSTKVPSGSRSAGTSKSATARSARSSSLTSAQLEKVEKAAAQVAAAAKGKSPARASSGAVSAKAAPRTVRAKPVVARAKKKKTTQSKRMQEITASSVAPEMAAAMLDEMGLGNEDAALEREAAREQRERDVLGHLAVAMNRHDDMPNQELAAHIVFNLDKEAISILVGAIERGDDVHASDAARVLCEVGNRDEDLLVSVQDRLVTLCHDGPSAMLPFAMYALSPIAERVAEQLWDLRELLWSVLSDGTEHAEMARAAAVRLLSALCASGPDYARTLAGGLVDLLGKCMPKDVALYAESVLPALGAAHSHRAKPVLDRRMKELTPAEVARLRRAVRVAQTAGLSAAA